MILLMVVRRGRYAAGHRGDLRRRPYFVERRTKEGGIRPALGAQQANTLRLILGRREVSPFFLPYSFPSTFRSCFVSRTGLFSSSSWLTRV